MQAILETIGEERIAKFGALVKGKTYKTCIFRNVDTNEKYIMYVYSDYDYINRDTSQIDKEIAHYIIKNNLIIGNVFEGLETYTLDKFNINNLHINNFNKTVKLCHKI